MCSDSFCVMSTDSKSGGVLAANLRQGFRSETLARFALSAFGPATDVEVEDDYGIDLVCATSRRDGRRLHVGPGYLVQVKSDDEQGPEYKGAQVRSWLEDLGSPLFVCRVDKAKTRIRLYSTWSISRVLLQLTAYGGQTPEAFRLVFDADVTTEQPAAERVPLGPPIIDFYLPELSGADYVRQLGSCIEEWVRMDTENIVRRRLGLGVAKGYTRWEPNRPPSLFNHWYKPYFYSPNTATQARAILAECATLLTVGNDPAEKELLRSYIVKYCDVASLEPVQRKWLGIV
jgi:hypothetical protein